MCATFGEELRGKFETEFQKEAISLQKSILIWLDKQEIADPKLKSINGK